MNDISKGIELFNDAEFFEAHDFFEEIWSDSPADEKFFFQALVHVSVASFHLISGKTSGAVSQYGKGIKKLKPYSPVFLNIDVELLINSVEKLLQELKGSKVQIPPGELINKLPKIILYK